MAHGKRSGTACKNGYTAYKATDRCTKNKARKMAAHLRAHPNDEQSAKAKAGSYTRKAPNNKGGWVTGLAFVKIGQFLAIPKDDKVNNISRSRAVQTRIAQHMAFDKASHNEQQYMQKKKKS